MSELGLGCARLGSITAGAGWRESVRLVQHAVDRGVTYFDTADAYGAGTSERVLGQALRGRSHELTLATKGGYRFDERSIVETRARLAVGGVLRRVRPGGGPQGALGGVGRAYDAQDFSPAYLTSALDASLRRLGTDHVDVYQLHGPRGADPDAVGEWSERMVSAGKIGRLGVGAETLDQAREWSSHRAVSTIQLPYGILDPEASGVIAEAHAAGRTVVARGVLGAGLLTDPDHPGRGSENAAKAAIADAIRALASARRLPVERLALWFVARRADVGTVVVGAGSRRHVDELAAAIASPVADEVMAGVDEIVARQTVTGSAG
jgi:aryl-alcohol dehydrogenase-like predicted oxidoreductase